MKKIFTLLTSISIAAFMSAQNANVTKTEFTEGEFISEFVWPIGLSADGSITWGYNPVGSLGYYNFNNLENPVSWTEYTDADYFGIKVAGIPFDGRPLVSNYLSSFFVNLETGEKEYIESPDPNLGIDAWDISSDGKYIGCNLTDEEFLVIPMLAEKQEDGTYKFTYLEYDDHDAMGCIAQYTQVRYVSEDGSIIAGIQPDNRGMSGRFVVWTRQADGTYKYNAPLDNFLYDKECPKPGYTPEWDDYVTADYETEPEEFAKQEAEFNKVWEEFEINYDRFTRNRSYIDMYSTIKETRCNKISLAYNDYRVEETAGIIIPLVYDCDEENIIEYNNIEGGATAVEQLPGGGDIIDDGFQLIAIDKEGNQKMFTDWFKEITNYDMTQVIYSGIPYFSEDGKTLMISGTNNENEAPSTIFRFDRDIFEAVTTGIKVNVMSEISSAGGKIMLGEDKQGIAEVFNLNGSKCGSYNVNGTIDFNNILARGIYLVKITVENDKPVTMKFVIK